MVLAIICKLQRHILIVMNAFQHVLRTVVCVWYSQNGLAETSAGHTLAKRDIIGCIFYFLSQASILKKTVNNDLILAI